VVETIVQIIGWVVGIVVVCGLFLWMIEQILEGKERGDD
jgi:hypothetical protein